jgi:dCMP deaminase
MASADITVQELTPAEAARREEDKGWLQLVDEEAALSGDLSRKVGAVIVRSGRLLSQGHNNLPCGCKEYKERRGRPLKYKWTEHAERNAIYAAARMGTSLQSATMYMRWFPCCDCARAIIQSGIEEIVAGAPDWNDSIWGDDFRISAEMFREAGIAIRFLPLESAA